MTATIDFAHRPLLKIFEPFFSDTGICDEKPATRSHESARGVLAIFRVRAYTLCFGRPWRTFNAFVTGTRPWSSAPPLGGMGHSCLVLVTFDSVSFEETQTVFRERPFWATKRRLKCQRKDCETSPVNGVSMKRGCYIGCPKGLSMICSIPVPGVLVAKPLRVSMPPVCLFSNIDHFPSISYIVYCTNSCSAHHSRACDLPLACSQLFL